MAKGAYIGSSGVAHKVKRGYVGVNTGFNSYETQTNQYSVTNQDSLAQLFDVVTFENATFSDNIITVSEAGSSIQLTAKYDMDVSLTVAVRAYFDIYGRVRIYQVNKDSSGLVLELKHDSYGWSEDTVCPTIKLDKGTDLWIETDIYSGNNNNTSRVGSRLSNISITTYEKVITSTTYKEVARRIRKAYIGVNGIARLCWSSGIMDRTGTAKLRRAKMRMAECSNDTHAFFLGGYVSHDYSDTYQSFSDVDIYDTTLTLSQVDLGSGVWFESAEIIGEYVYVTSAYRQINTSTFAVSYNSSIGYGLRCSASCRTSNYAWFAGGSSSLLYANVINAAGTHTEVTYLTGRGNILLAGASVNNCALFGGGTLASGGTDNYNSVTAWDDSLTQKYPTALSESKAELAATETSNHALFAGGWIDTASGYSDTVEAYNSSLTKTIIAPLSRKVSTLSAASANGYAIFAGGTGGTNPDGVDEAGSDCVDIYDSSLTKHTGEPLSSPRWYLSATAIGSTVLIAGGLGPTNFGQGPNEYSDVIDVYMLNV